MFLEKNFRYVRHYRFTTYGRKKAAPVLPLIGEEDEYSILEAVEKSKKAGEAFVRTTNGEIVEVVDIQHFDAEGVVAFLFHRAHPDAADPSYRRKVGGAITVRQGEKEDDEEQSVSAHVIIRVDPYAPGVYDVIFEEIPGLPLSVIQPIFARALNAYKYRFNDKRGKEQETYTVLKVQGVKSEKLTDALKTGSFGYITLSRPAEAPFIDSEDIFKPMDQKMKIRIEEDIDPETWRDLLGGVATGAREAGWPDFQVDITLDDERHKTIKVERGQEGKEILFVRSERVDVDDVELPTCSDGVIAEFVRAAV